jgi:NhaP-type Na+/H+ or K+/H+ antiporter
LHQRIGYAPGLIYPAVGDALATIGLRGALAIALALALPTDSSARAPIVTATYAIALFSTLVQAMTVEPLARRWTRRAASAG